MFRNYTSNIHQIPSKTRFYPVLYVRHGLEERFGELLTFLINISLQIEIEIRISIQIWPYLNSDMYLNSDTYLNYASVPDLIKVGWSANIVAFVAFSFVI